MEIILASLLGMLTGIIVGLLPGIGSATVLLILFPLLQNVDLLSLFIFYAVLVSASQYFGSVSSIVYGVAGEISSMPAVTHGHPLFQQGRGAEVLSLTSTASFVSATLGIGMLLLVFSQLPSLLWVYHNTVLTAMYVVIMVAMVMLTKNKTLSLVMLLAGLTLGKIGFDVLFRANILAPAYSVLSAGLPFYALFLGFITVPILIKLLADKQPMESNPIDGINLTIANRFKMLFSLTEIKSVLRGSILGGFIGILPGASYALSSSICDRIEKKFNDSGLARLLAAESANNSAAITVLIPLLFLAIPIVYSESILLGIAEGMGFGITTSVSFLTDNIKPILLTLFVSNVILWIIAGSLYRAVITLYNYTQKYLYQGMLLSAVIMVTWLGYLGNQLLLSLSVFVICVLAGWKITANDSKLVLVFAFFIADSAIDELYRFYLLNF